jgi:hypothetical protein
MYIKTESENLEGRGNLRDLGVDGEDSEVGQDRAQ